MTSAFMAKVQKDFETEKSNLDWNSYLAGYIASLKRFGSVREDRRTTKRNLGYSRIGRNNV